MATERLDPLASQDSPTKQTRLRKYRPSVLVISDSDSDSDLPPPVSLLRPRAPNPPAPRNPIQDDDIIDISSDSDVDATPIRPRAPPPKHKLGDASLSGVTELLNATSLFETLEHPNIAERQICDQSDDDEGHKDSRYDPGLSPDARYPSVFAARNEDRDSSDITDSDGIDIFDQDACHPGLIKFDITSPRRPIPKSGSSSTSVSTPATTPASSQSTDDIDDPFGDVRTPNASKIGNVRAGSSGSRIKPNKGDTTTTPETPRHKPRGKARAAVLAAASPTVVPLTPRNRAKLLEARALALFSELNGSVFDDRLPEDCRIIWSKKLNTTAGRAHWKRIRDASGNVLRHETFIELSTKVVDCDERVDNTLSHEMCHLAAWIFNEETNKQHGPMFKQWANRVMNTRPDISITTCHSYQIAYKYEWKCSSDGCSQTYGRHSKSIDPTKQDYLKTHMKTFKAANPGMQHGEVMKRLGEMFRAEKEAIVDDELDQVMAGMTKLKLCAAPEGEEP